MESITKGIITGIIIGGVVSLLFIIKYVLVKLLDPPKDPKITPILFTYFEINSLNIPENVFCSITAHENALEIETATVTHKRFLIEYPKILKFETIPKYDYIFRSYSLLKKATDLPDRLILKYLDDAGIEQKLQLKFDQGKKEKKINLRSLWNNNIFDYVNARINKNNDTI